MKAPGTPQFQAPVPIAQTSGASPMAHAIGRVSQAVDKTASLAADMQREQEQQWLTEAEVAMRRKDVDIQQHLIQNKFSPQKHVPEAEKMYHSAVESLINNDSFTPGFRQQLSQRLAIHTSSRLDKIGTDAKVMQIENGRRVWEMGIAMDVEDENFGGAAQRIKDGAGTYYPSGELDFRLREIEKQEQNVAINQSILDNPSEQLDMIENKVGPYADGEMSSENREMYRNYAERENYQNQRTSKNHLTTLVDANVINTPSDMREHLKSEQFDWMTDTEKDAMVNGMTRSGHIEPTEEEYRQVNLMVDQLGYDLSEGRLEYGSKEHHARWRAIDGTVAGLPSSYRRGNWLKRMHSLDPLTDEKDSGELLPRLQTDYLSTGKNRMIELMERGLFSPSGVNYYRDPKNVTAESKGGRGWMSGPEHLDNRLKANKVSEKAMDKARRDFIAWMERNKNQPNIEAKYEEYFDNLEDELIIKKRK